MTTNRSKPVMGEVTTTKPRIPEVGEYVRTYGTLVEVQDVTPPVVQVLDYIFEDTSATWELRINGKLVQDFSTINNFYGQDTCVPEAIKEAKILVKKLGETDAEVVVVKITERVRMRPSRDEHFYDPAFREFKSLDHGCRWNLPDEKREDVWSSKRGDLTKGGKTNAH